MDRIKFVRVGNVFIALFCVCIIALGLWIYVSLNPTPLQFRYNISEDSNELIIRVSSLLYRI